MTNSKQTLLLYKAHVKNHELSDFSKALRTIDPTGSNEQLGVPYHDYTLIFFVVTEEEAVMLKLISPVEIILDRSAIYDTIKDTLMETYTRIEDNDVPD